jgi:integrase
LNSQSIATKVNDTPELERFLLETITNSYSKNDRALIQTRFRTLLDFLKTKHSFHWKALEDPQILQAFLDALCRKDELKAGNRHVARSDRTLKRYVDILKKAISSAVMLKYLDRDVTVLLNVPEPEKKLFKGLKIGEVIKIISHKKTREEKFSDFISAIFFTGRRLKEASHLRWEKVDWGAGTYIYYDFKSKEEKEAILSPLFRQLLKRRDSKKEGYIFPEWVGKESIVSKKFPKLCMEAGVRVVSLHKTRRSLITAVKADAKTGSRMLGNLPGRRRPLSMRR